ncbi:MAG: HD domain-containing phosphohydrolase, partial [Candidatus Thorarchaeota archaeon]
RKKWIKGMKEIYASGVKHHQELEFGGRVFLFEQAPITDEGYINVYATDITERKKAEERTKRLLDQQVAINELSSALGEERALESIYHTIYEHVSRMMNVQAFIVSFYDGETKLIRAGYVLHGGQELDTGSFPPIPLEEEGHGTQSQVIRTGKPLYFPNYDIARIETKPRTAYDVTVSNGATQTEQATRGEGRSSPNKSVLYVPMKIESEVIGVMQVQSQRVEAYSKDDEELLAGLASVAAIAIQNSRLNAEALADAAKLRAAFKGTIEALAQATETRDPYTAGHQMRVAELASAIAEELRLPTETLESIQVSGMVHDIGKLAVPAEILSKPSTLGETEYHLIQAHVETAYDILRTIDFPWPVAEIVLQHHERLDGSGYPNGLKSDEILLEARIIGVADVVEAMSSHRPYRPALGIDAALEEIKSKKNICYDSDAVDACIRLFGAGFSFSDRDG